MQEVSQYELEIETNITNPVQIENRTLNNIKGNIVENTLLSYYLFQQ